MKEINEKFCPECGEKINIKAEICPKCGVRQPYLYSSNDEQKKDDNKWLITLLLCWFLGVFGIHRFYTGHTVIGVVQLLTLGGCGIWALVDFIMIIVGSYKDADGNPIKNK
ncbi:TM2 domain-containing protein [Paludibacter sp.]